MAKVVKFNFEDSQDNTKVENLQQETTQQDEEDLIRLALEDHILSNFAVKTILGMDFVYKISKNDIGVIGQLAYEHKRRPGVFVADYIAKGYKQKDKYVIDSLAFQLGEPEFYKQILNILKAKKALPEL
ncbi:hypothetical protein [Sulfurihydrogenibium azorense]|jgi:outer membrane protein W|uniref:Uncharacterized protein n=1 Tax=Sulfurihydrogenibium azorense (strain DSM 15241 / OCM 825 / Az-Fu1) TaxID=204536 RepID=C1DWQ1_SULAA|nr:hypothetical protein [Sulfurihydrogenibium azorense]ACN99288.1 hypothetical protein SULAZ_1574 [Sulfurihydrogenibium azorense Az-Fu1]MDM7273237.1 hypothetical protein [Sulfurihydrogenibium azorense]